MFNLHALVDLNLSCNKLSDLGFVDTESALKRLKMANNSVSKISKRVVASELESLDLSRNKLASVNNLSTAFPNIEALDVSHNDIVLMDGLKSLAACASLFELSIAGNPVHYAGIAQIIKKRFSNLEVLDGADLCEETLMQREINALVKNLGKLAVGGQIDEIDSRLNIDEPAAEDEQAIFGDEKTRCDTETRLQANNKTLECFYENYTNELNHKLTEIRAELKTTQLVNVDDAPARSEARDTPIAEVSEAPMKNPASTNLEPLSAQPTTECVAQGAPTNSKSTQKVAQAPAPFRIRQSSKASGQLMKAINSHAALKNPRLLKQQTELLRLQLQKQQ